MEGWRLAPAGGSRVAVIGGAGGIGRAVVAGLLAFGATVAVLDLPAAIAAAPPPDAVRSVTLDATDAASVATGFAALADWRALDACVVLAGFTAARTTVEALAPETWEEVVAGNLRSAFLVARAALPLLRRGRDPALVLTSSGLAARAQPGYGPYAAAKAGVIALTRTLALEAAPDVRVNCVAPGAVRTAFLEGGTGRPSRSLNFDADAYAATVPLRRIATAEDVAGPVLFLLGPAARYMTGQTLHVNGGLLMP